MTTADSPKRRVFVPSFLLPLGAIVTLGAWATGNGTSWVGWLGMAAFGVGLAAHILSRVLHKKAVSGVMQGQRDRQAQHLELSRLDRRLRKDRDPRTQDWLRDLRVMSGRFDDHVRQSGLADDARFDALIHGADELFDQCVRALERSATLWEAAVNMNTDEARAAALEDRGTVLDDVETTIQHLGQTYDGITTLSLSDSEAKMAPLRAELEQNLAVARRVDERMRDMQRSLESNRLTS